MSPPDFLNLQSSRPLVMGILNVTPDSFSDGGSFSDLEAAVAHAHEMLAEGVDVIDVGGESTRPGAPDVDLKVELSRVLPVIEALKRDSMLASLPLSVDTSKPQVMRAAIEAGAGMVNDVRALQEPGALEVCVEYSIQVCLMHMQGKPRTMQHAPSYVDVVEDVTRFLIDRRDMCVAAGLPVENIVLDPGFGFGKTLAHNLALLNGLDRICSQGSPVLVGISRKSMFQEILGVSVDQRLIGSVSAALIAAMKGAGILRVHDVRETVEAVRVLQAVENMRSEINTVAR